MLMNLNGDDDCRARALKALRSPDESRDYVLRKFVRLASQALGISSSFISVWTTSTSTCRPPTILPSHNPRGRTLSAVTWWTATARRWCPTHGWTPAL